MKAIELENNHGTVKSQGKILKNALESCNETSIYFLMNAKHLWKKEKDLDEAINILKKGLEKMEDEEELYLALAKLYKEKRMYDEGRKLLQKGRQICDSARIWMQSAQIEREIGENKQALTILDTAIEKYPKFYKNYLIYATLLLEAEDYTKAREIYEKAIIPCQQIPQIWVCYSQMEQMLQNYAKARAILQKGRIKIKSNDLLWLETIRLEIRNGDTKTATHLCSKALQNCPESGKLWSLAIELEPVHQRKAKGLQALKP
mmetsp:Transcript_22310/g.19811  ORF Transcript_22310/g.19811 Transcript_22310/m.19811 type:complete len:261 (+) Transcript_22310:79-861(+)